MTLLFDLIYLLVVCLGWPLLILRRIKRGPGSVALSERLGKLPSRPVSGKCVWIHAVSMGETNATRTLVAELRRRIPDCVVVMSSTTQTGLARARQLYPDLLVFRFPLDFSFVIRRVLNQVRPSAIVLMELEVWPNLMEVAAARGVPVLIANGRVTEGRSMKRFRLPIIRSLARRMFRRVSWVGAQDRAFADRFVELGVPKECVHVVGSIKYDTADLTDRVPGQEQLAAAMGIIAGRPLWVCGSTGPGEEEQVLEAYERVLQQFPELQLAIIPRKPERFDEVAALILKRGFACLRRSTGSPTLPDGVDEPRPVFLGDTMGELRKFYGLATIAFVGRSLVPMGGSDMIEAAALGRAVLFGPYTENFAEAVDLLLAANACRRVNSVDGLATAVASLLRHPERREEMGLAARDAVASRQGATDLTVDALLNRML